MKAKLNCSLSALLALAFLFTVGCSKSTMEFGNASDGVTSLSSCANPAATKLDPAALNVEIVPVAQIGQPVTYKANLDLACSTTQRIAWKISGDDAASVPMNVNGQEMTTTFQKTGTYFVTASIVENSANDSVGTSGKAAGGSVVGIGGTTVVVSNAPAIVGPLVGTINGPMTYSLAVPLGMSIVASSWNFGDGSSIQTQLPPVTHSYAKTGSKLITADVEDSSGNIFHLRQQVNVVGIYDGLNCLSNIALISPYEGVVGEPVPMVAVIPGCMQSLITSITWSFGDGSTNMTGPTASHSFATAGDYTVSAVILSPLSPNASFITLSRTIHISDPQPAPTPAPAPVCPSASRDTYSADETKKVACGTDGQKDVTSAVKITEECSVSGGILIWTETSRTTIIKKEGVCSGQSCRMPDGSLLPDKGTKTLYSNSAPQGTCADSSQTRTCDNGTLSGSSAYVQTACRSGCGSFGPDGTSKSGVVIGETSIPVACPFGETGITDAFESLADQTCSDGKIIESNRREGKKTKAGTCPTYSWIATDSWGACSADCGGQQNRIYECRDDKGVKAESQRCADQMPEEPRICDGNPDAVVREESSTVQEQAGSTTESCPKNEIGVIFQIRDVNTKKTYGCVDHKVEIAKTETNNSPWTTERYCRKYVAHRCSQDSLGNAKAEGRYQWMKKCADQVPEIKKFLEDFKDVAVSGKYTISNSGGRHLYPTFMNTATSPEKPWIAPTKASAPCDVPSTAYVATVCLSSCATPEQQILAAAEAKASLRNMSFIDSLTQNAGFAATLQSSSSMSSKDVVKTKVQQWVTEMMDTDHDIVEFHTKSGRLLRLTTNHPVLADDGSMKLAGGLKVGENLVRLGGELDPIVSIDQMKYHGKVYNLFVESAEPRKNIVVTNGFLNGTAFFQNEEASLLNRILLRKRLIRATIP